MRLLYLNYSYDPRLKTPEALLDLYAPALGMLPALKRAGIESVCVVQRFSRRASFERSGVEYHFFDDRLRPDLGFGQIPRALHDSVVDLAPDLVHVNGMHFPLQLLDLRRR